MEFIIVCVAATLFAIGLVIWSNHSDKKEKRREQKHAHETQH